MEPLSEVPALLTRIDGHAVWVNSESLRLANITRATPDPPGGVIERDAAGEATGILLDDAADLVVARLPPATEAELRKWCARLAASGGAKSWNCAGD